MMPSSTMFKLSLMSPSKKASCYNVFVWIIIYCTW